VALALGITAFDRIRWTQ